MMEISDVGKRILEEVGAKEIPYTALTKKFKSGENIGSELPMLEQMGLLEQVDGYISLTDVGVKVMRLETKEIPTSIEEELNKAVKLARSIKINKPGAAIKERYSATGVKPKSVSEAKKQRHMALERLKNNPKPAHKEYDEEDVSLEGAEEMVGPENIEQVTSIITCPVFGEIKRLFCEACCEAYSTINSNCTLSESMARRLKL